MPRVVRDIRHRWNRDDRIASLCRRRGFDWRLGPVRICDVGTIVPDNFVWTKECWMSNVSVIFRGWWHFKTNTNTNTLTIHKQSYLLNTLSLSHLLLVQHQQFIRHTLQRMQQGVDVGIAHPSVKIDEEIKGSIGCGRTGFDACDVDVVLPAFVKIVSVHSHV